MRTLAITQNITLDGSIEMLGDWFDPQRQADTDNTDLLELMHRNTRDSDALLLGRQTFEDFRGYWPEQTDDQTGISDSLNNQNKYVVSTTMTEPGWQNSTVLSGGVVDAVQALKERPGLDIIVTGSITLCHTLIEAGLVDEYRLFTYPVVQGSGRRLFPDWYVLPRLTLLEARAFRSGITYAAYAPAITD